MNKHAYMEEIGSAMSTPLEPGMESLADVIQVLSQGMDIIHNALKKVTANDVPVLQKVDIPNDIIAKLNKLSKEDKLKNQLVFGPRNLDEYMLPSLKLLHTQLKEICDVESRLIKPITDWIDNVVTNEGVGAKVWNTKKMTTVDLKKYLKGSSSLFSLSPHRVVGDPTQYEFSELYAQNNSFKLMGQELNAVVITSQDIDLEKIQKSEARLTKSVDLFIGAYNHDELSDIHPENMRKLATYLQQAANEVEYLAVLIHLCNVFHSAYKESITVLCK